MTRPLDGVNSIITSGYLAAVPSIGRPYAHETPVAIEQQLHSTNPLERLNKEIKRRSNVVAIFPDVRAAIRQRAADRSSERRTKSA